MAKAVGRRPELLIGRWAFAAAQFGELTAIFAVERERRLVRNRRIERQNELDAKQIDRRNAE
jgi:hypothetical protein